MTALVARPLLLGIGLSMVTLAGGHALSGCIFTSASDCELTRGFGCSTSGSSTSTSTSSGGSGGMSGSSTTTSTSGGSGGTSSTSSVECSDASMCTGLTVPPGPCASLAKVACTANKCVLEYTAGDAPSQQYGSCKKKTCDGNGVATDENDDTNVYDDGNPCTEEKCNGGILETSMLFNTACSIGGSSGYCVPDPYNPALLVCSECLSTGDCTGGAICSAGHCVPAHCNDTATSLGETDKNCGGGTQSGCLKCSAGKVCNTGATDCASGICMSNKCVAATCSDGVQNADETDTDCSGLNCPNLCADGRKCITGADCTSGVCMPSATPGEPNTCQKPSCTDGVQNDDETGVDCGGASCPPCAP